MIPVCQPLVGNVAFFFPPFLTDRALKEHRSHQRASGEERKDRGSILSFAMKRLLSEFTCAAMGRAWAVLWDRNFEYFQCSRSHKSSQFLCHFPPYQDGVETHLTWLQEHFILYRLGASVSTGKYFPLVGLYKGLFLVLRSGKLTQLCAGGCQRQCREGGTGIGMELLKATHIARA